LVLYFALKGAPSGLDPVRIQKGMFLLAKEGGLPEDEVYDFGAYHYGPMSSAVYDDVDELEAAGLIRGEKVPGYSWKRYRPTTKGIEAARAMKGEASRDGVRKLFEIKQHVVSKTFSGLLREIYAKYPEYASRSVFSG
jgi:uncharacterized protein YwgA